MPWFHPYTKMKALYTHQMAPMQSKAPSQPYSENLSGTPGVTRKPLPLSCYIQYCLFLSKDICLPRLLRLVQKKKITLLFVPWLYFTLIYCLSVFYCMSFASYIVNQVNTNGIHPAVETQNAASGLLKKVVFWQHRK